MGWELTILGLPRLAAMDIDMAQVSRCDVDQVKVDELSEMRRRETEPISL